MRTLALTCWFSGRLKTFAFVAILVMVGLASWAIVTDLSLIRLLHKPQAVHIDQKDLKALVVSGQKQMAFQTAFETGNGLFDATFNVLDGVGANVGQGQRFTRVPRADLRSPGEWATHTPFRVTGPNAQSCTSCHNQSGDDGSGSAAANVHRDPLHSANLSLFIQRNTPHLFAAGAIQRLAEEMSAQLISIRDSAQSQVCANGGSLTKALTAKGVDFGTITLTRTATAPCIVKIDTSTVKGVSADLIIRPFQWKGNVAFIRDFNRGASHNELGMQAVEITGDGVDGDRDGVFDEMTVGDQTALSVYIAAQPRPTTKIELAYWDLIDLSWSEYDSINRGAAKFAGIACTQCHVPMLKIDSPTFSEPSKTSGYRDTVFPAGQDPVSRGVDPAFPITFNLTRDQPENQLVDRYGKVIFRLGALKKDSNGRAVVELFGDLKRHDMGSGLAESIDEAGTGSSVFLTENLWGVGSTAPYLHDGRATTLTEAILEHGGEAAASRSAFLALIQSDQRDVLTYLNNLVLFKLEEE